MFSMHLEQIYRVKLSLQSVFCIRAEVNVGTTLNMAITVTVPSNAESGSVSIVTVTATPSSSAEFLITTFTVTARDNNKATVSY